MNDAHATPESLFQHLIAMLASSALQQLGLLQGADGQESNLEAASATIDLLDVLKEKTQGNLTSDEEKMLTESLASLKMAFVQMNQGPAAETAAPEPAAAPPEEDRTEGTGEPAPDLHVPNAVQEEKTPKFHKKYD